MLKRFASVLIGGLFLVNVASASDYTVATGIITGISGNTMTVSKSGPGVENVYSQARSFQVNKRTRCFNGKEKYDCSLLKESYGVTVVIKNGVAVKIAVRELAS